MTVRDLLYEKIENSPSGSVIDITCPVLCWQCRTSMTVKLEGLTVTDRHSVSRDQDGNGRLTRELRLPNRINIVCHACGYVNERWGIITIITTQTPIVATEDSIFYRSG
jgi:hypothetical protein